KPDARFRNPQRSPSYPKRRSSSSQQAHQKVNATTPCLLLPATWLATTTTTTRPARSSPRSHAVAAHPTTRPATPYAPRSIRPRPLAVPLTPNNHSGRQSSPSSTNARGKDSPDRPTEPCSQPASNELALGATSTASSEPPHASWLS